MTESLVNIIYVRFGGQLFRQPFGVPIGTSCAASLADLFLYSCKNEFLDKPVLKGGQTKAC